MHLAPGRVDVGRHGGVGHRKDGGPNAEFPAEHRGRLGEAHAASEHLSSRDVHRPVLVPDGDELLDAESREEVVRDGGVVADSPPLAGIEDARKEVHDRIGIRREVIAGEPHILGCVDDDCNLPLLQQLQHASEELRGPGPAREEGYH